MNENSIGNWKTIVDKPVNGNSLGRIDQYELIRELGGGGFGTVFLARDTESEVDVAVKGLPPFVKNNREEMENIRSNFRLVHDLHHPHIAAALVLHPAKSVSYFAEDVKQKLRILAGDTLLVMAYAPGVTLSQWRKQFPENKVPFEKAIEITRQIADALDYAHERKVVHRDIKPANVMIETDADGKVTARVLDFGLAAEIRSSMGRVSREITDTSGTRPYMAPEQWLGGKQGPATDQYSLAVLFHELVTGAVPFESVFQTGDPVVMMNVVGREAPKLPSDLPKPARLALEKALAKTPEDRFSSCTEFVKAIEGKVKVKSPSDGKSPLPKIAGVLLAALCLGGGVWYWQDAKAKEQARIVAAKKAEADRKAVEEARIALEKAQAEAAEKSRKAEEARLAAEKKAEAERKAAEKARITAEKKAKAEYERKINEAKSLAAQQKAATEIRVEALVQKGRIERLSDADGFKNRKDELSDTFARAEALFDDKVKRWSESAQGFTNYIIGCKNLLILDNERNYAAVMRVDAEKLKSEALRVKVEKYAPIKWMEAVKLMESADKLFEQMNFASASSKFISVAKLFAQCVDEAESERERQDEIAEKNREKEKKMAAKQKIGDVEGVRSPKKLTSAAQKLVGFWSCQCEVTYHDSLGSRADDFIKSCLPVSSTISLNFSDDGTVSISDSSGRTFGVSNGKWKYRYGMVIMDLKSDDGRAFRLSGIINWRGNSFELHYDNAEYANMIRKTCEGQIADINAVLSSYIDGQLEVSISTKMPSFKMGNARCTPHIFTRK